MNKEELILKNCITLSKNARENEEALTTAMLQLFRTNPEQGIKCWEQLIRDHLSEIEVDFGKDAFSEGNIGKILVEDLEFYLCGDPNYFPDAIDDFANNAFLMDVIYSKSPLYPQFSGKSVISLLIESDGWLDDAEKMVSALYQNKTFHAYAELWKYLLDELGHDDESHFKKQRDFCMAWIERIPDDEERAAAMTYVVNAFWEILE